MSRKVSPDPPFRHVSFRYANLHVPGWFAWGGMGTYFPLLKTRGKTQDTGGAGISNISRTPGSDGRCGRRGGRRCTPGRSLREPLAECAAWWE